MKRLKTYKIFENVNYRSLQDYIINMSDKWFGIEGIGKKLMVVWHELDEYESKYKIWINNVDLFDMRIKDLFDDEEKLSEIEEKYKFLTLYDSYVVMQDSCAKTFEIDYHEYTIYLLENDTDEMKNFMKLGFEIPEDIEEKYAYFFDADELGLI